MVCALINRLIPISTPRDGGIVDVLQNRRAETLQIQLCVEGGALPMKMLSSSIRLESSQKSAKGYQHERAGMVMHFRQAFHGRSATQ